jgi:23S rRNA pseudouridine1911/1915/1917 synthase
MQELGLEILLDDDCLLAINKPSGLPTQAPRQFDSVERRIRAWLEQMHGPDAYLGVPHRLDRPASGVLLLAKTPRAARLISRQFERRQIQKNYCACVSGCVEPPEGIWHNYIRKLPGIPKVEIVTSDSQGALEAILRYRVIGQSLNASWLEIEPETGRTHQIRVQAATRGYPVLGDALYGSTIAFGVPTEDERERAIALHARLLTFRHPSTREPCAVTAEPPAAWRNLTEFAPHAHGYPLSASCCLPPLTTGP